MKWFYPASVVLVLAAVVWPFFVLREAGPPEYEGLVVLYDSLGSAVKSIDPATCGDTTSSVVQGNVYEGLYAYHYLKRPPEVVPQLAAEMPKVSADGLTYTIRLKSGVKFHRNPCFGTELDGKAKTRTVKAEDFVFAFKRIADYNVEADLSWTFLSERVAGLDAYHEKTKDYKPGDFSRYDIPVEGIKALDELTLQIKLVEPFPQFLHVLAMHVYAPIPREAAEYWLLTESAGRAGRKPLPPDKVFTEFREAEQVVGTGPYVLDTFKRKQKIVLKRNADFRPDYYPAEGEEADRQAGLLADAGKRAPFIDVLHYDYVAEDYSAWMRFLSKQTDASAIPPETFQFVITPGRDLTDSWRQRGIYLKKSSSPIIYWIVFNMEDPVLGASPSLRQALCLAFDVENYIKVLVNGRGKRAVNIIPSTFEGHKEAGPGPYYRLDLELTKKKIEQARKELADAGRLVNGQMPELKFDVAEADPYTIRMTEFVQQQFAKVGVKVKVVFNDWPMLQQKTRNKQTQMYTMGWHADYPDAENFLQLFYSPNIAKYTNNSNYSNPEFDKLYDQIRTMPDTPQRAAIYARMAQMISEDCPVLLLSEPEGFVLYYDWVSNVKRHPIGYGFAKYLRIDTDLRRRLGGR